MEVKSTYKFARISSRKARNIAREIQGVSASEALGILKFNTSKGALLFEKVLKSAIAGAENEHEVPVDSLTIKSAIVNEGSTFKRIKPRARGSASPIRKRTSHIVVVLGDGVDSKKDKKVDNLKSKIKSNKTFSKKKALKKDSDVREKPKNKVSNKSSNTSKSNFVNEHNNDMSPVKKSNVEVEESYGLVYKTKPNEVDDLKRISGVGEVLEEKLNSHGIYTFSQIAKWSEKNIEEFDKVLNFKGRIKRDEWINKARDLHKEKYGEDVEVEESYGLVYKTKPNEVDDLKRISGVGEVLEEKLNSHGIYTFSQIAKWSEKNIEEFDKVLNFKGRIKRDEWINKARDLHKEKYGEDV